MERMENTTSGKSRLSLTVKQVPKAKNSQGISWWTYSISKYISFYNQSLYNT